MKSTLKSILFAAVVSLFAASCAKEAVTPVSNVDEQLVKVTLIAGNPEVAPATPSVRTEMEGSQPYWSVGDAIGVSNGTSTNNKFTTDITERSTSASFTGSTAVSSTLYAYYPYTSNGVGLIQDTYYGAKVDLPNNQNPTSTSFDGKADIMVAKQFTVDPENTTVEDLEFARLGAVVKIVLIDKDGTMTGTQHPTTVSMTAESTLAGRVLIDMQNQQLVAPYYNPSSIVTANYSSDTKYAIDGTNATYLVVYPQTLAEGSTLTIAASTEDYTLSKDITVPAGGIDLQAGKVTTLKVKFAAANITSGAGAALPFTDDFSWQTGTGENGLSSVDEAYSAFENVYEGKASGVIRLGKSAAVGYLTTKELDLSSAFYVVVSARAYNAGDNSKIKVTVDGETTQTASTALTSTDTFTDYIFNFSAATKKSKVTITTDTKRAVLTDLQIISGTYVFPPVINVTTDNPLAVANTASSQTINYTIENATEATLTASSTVSWISNIDCSTDGKVTFDVAAQASGATARSGIITLSYNGASDVEVTVKQAAGSGATQDYTNTWTATSGAIAEKTSGTIENGDYDWSFTRDNVYTGFSSGCIQLGSKSGAETVTLSTSLFPGTIKSVSVECASYQGAHKCSISVGGVEYLPETATSSWTTVGPLSGTGSSSGEIKISFTNGTRALYIKSITVVYNN
ncbi:MAG: hypothetical protein IJM41_02140 [Bacteroidales bacterium]|nr:hypothetical protein [Bacteroidales bacterium]